MSQRICSGCGVQLQKDHESSFCSLDCQSEFNLSQAYANMVYRELDDLVNRGIAPELRKE